MRRKMLTLLCMLVLSAVLVAGFGAYLRDQVLKPLGLFQEEHPVKVIFMLMADEGAQYALENRDVIQEAEPGTEESTEPGTEESTEPGTEESTEPGTEESTEPGTEESTEPGTEESTEPGTEESTEPGTEESTEPGTEESTEPGTEESTEPGTEKSTEPGIEEDTQSETEETTEPIVITEDWFDDALFIGDSRTAGLRDMARLGGAHYYCASSMSVFQIMTTRCSDHVFYNKTLDYVLTNYTYGKIYIHLGMNECYYDHELVIQKYQEVIDLIREKQPDAAIIIQAVMTVRDYFANSTKFTLERITGLNDKLLLLAEENEIFFEDTNEFAANEEGYMRPQISYDGAHPLGSGYEEWAQWTMDNAVNWGIE